MTSQYYTFSSKISQTHTHTHTQCLDLYVVRMMNVTMILIAFFVVFISAGGPECFQDKQQALQDCANATFGSYLPKPDPSSNSLVGLESLPSLTFGLSECRYVV